MGLDSLREFAVGVQRRIFNATLKEARICKGYTILALADMVGCSMPYLYQIASFRIYPSQRLRDRLCCLLEIPEDVLFPSWLAQCKVTKQPEPIVIPMSALPFTESLQLEGPDDVELENVIDQGLLREQIGQTLSLLPPKERQVLQLRFGLEDNKIHTAKEIAEMFHLTRARIHQIERETLKHLRCSRSKEAHSLRRWVGYE